SAQRKAIIIDVLDATSREFDNNSKAVEALTSIQRRYPALAIRVTFTSGPPKVVNWQGLG
ncbi:MAG: hypothetical protein ACRDTG_07335, partial [Pseudonocardiaceae bacterium]